MNILDFISVFLGNVRGWQLVIFLFLFVIPFLLGFLIGRRTRRK